MSILTLRIPDELDQALERQSAGLGISKSDLALEALSRYLRVAEFRTLRTKLVARSQAGDIDTEEDVFEALKQSVLIAAHIRRASTGAERLDHVPLHHESVKRNNPQRSLPSW